MTTSSGSVRREQTGDMTHPQDVTIHDGIRYYPDSPDGALTSEVENTQTVHDILHTWNYYSEYYLPRIISSLLSETRRCLLGSLGK